LTSDIGGEASSVQNGSGTPGSVSGEQRLSAGLSGADASATGLDGVSSAENTDTSTGAEGSIDTASLDAGNQFGSDSPLPRLSLW